MMMTAGTQRIKQICNECVANPACTIDRDFCDRDSRSDFGVLMLKYIQNFHNFSGTILQKSAIKNAISCFFFTFYKYRDGTPSKKL